MKNTTAFEAQHKQNEIYLVAVIKPPVFQVSRKDQVTCEKFDMIVYGEAETNIRAACCLKKHILISIIRIVLYGGFLQQEALRRGMECERRILPMKTRKSTKYGISQIILFK